MKEINKLFCHAVLFVCVCMLCMLGDKFCQSIDKASQRLSKIEQLTASEAICQNNMVSAINLRQLR